MVLPNDIQAIQQVINTNLAGEVAHLEMLPTRKASSKLLKEAESYRESAVAILLFRVNEVLRSVLIQRQTYNGPHSGQVSFPGGKRDSDDENLIQTALREMHEEIGFDDENIVLLGELTRIFIPVSHFLVYPYVFYTEKMPVFDADSIEVSEIIQFDLYDITAATNKTVTKIKMENGALMTNIPCFVIQDKIVWGATALMMNELRWVLEQIPKIR